MTAAGEEAGSMEVGCKPQTLVPCCLSRHEAKRGVPQLPTLMPAL